VRLHVACIDAAPHTPLKGIDTLLEGGAHGVCRRWFEHAQVKGDAAHMQTAERVCAWIAFCHTYKWIDFK
jgi:hypothetical protein